jgi:hemerythrin superfamily protein
VNPQDRYATEYADDVVALLVAQHEELKALMSAVLQADGRERGPRFAEFREALTRHEAAEEQVLRPLTRSAPGGAAVAEGRSSEEERAERLLAFLADLEPDGIAFATEFQELQEAVLRHAENEETEEFPLLRRTHDPETLRAARTAVERVEAGDRPGGDRPGVAATVRDAARRLLPGR